jgi:TonB-dependent SusC/RagA subfamily outer membrane receptor
MKNILFVFLLFSTTLFAQQTEKDWDDVITYENESKIKSANEKVAKLYKKAVDNKDEVQIIRCFFYQSKYLQILVENAQTKIINNLKTEINQSTASSKAILNLVYAKCLIDYAARNEYKIRQRTTIKTLDDDFLTWTQKNFDDQIDKAMKESLENESLLKKVPLTKYESIFDYSTEENFKTENLFTYILRENITFYTKKIHTWEIIKDVFTPFKKELLGKSDPFIKLNFSFVGNESLRLVLSLYQKQEANYPTDENQFNRILFFKNYIFEPDAAYVNALTELQKSTKNENLVQKIQLEKATNLQLKASKNNNPDYNIKALLILDSILKINNRSNSYKSALLQKQSILSKSLTIQLQKYTYNNETTRAFIEYKNVEQLQVSFYKISQNQLIYYNTFYKNRDSLVDAIIKKSKPVSSELQPLKSKNDHFEYSTEVLLKHLKTGTYLAYFESESDVKDKKAIAYETITVSNLSVLAIQNDSKETFQVLDRKSGKPLENVVIKSPRSSTKTDKNGVAYFKKNNNNYNEDLTLSLNNDTLLIPKNYIQHNNYYTGVKTENSKRKVEFYLDRAIYRPGQTVYFKGIAIQKNNTITSVIPNSKYEILIKDANDTELKQIDVTTNDFGSFSGEFILPKNGITGNFKITAEEPDNKKKTATNKTDNNSFFRNSPDFEYSQIDFKVEEYKRPKFEITFDSKKETYQLNQSIKVNGTAKAFAGSTISDAIVTYHVKRYVNYSNDSYGREDDEEIADGEVKTDATGKFVIDFIASPAENSNKEKLPVFNYEIFVSVTDINGETRTASTAVKVGYHDLILGVQLPYQIETKDKNEIKLTSSNLNGEFLATKGEVKIYYVRPFSNKFKARVWTRPEIENISDQDFEQLFPYEINTTQTAEKPKEILVFSKNIDTEINKKIDLDFISDFKSGGYKIVFAAKDSFNNPIETTTNFELTQSADKFNPSKLFTAQQINEDPKKDGFVQIKIKSVIPELYIVTSGYYDNQIFFEETNHLLNNETILKIPLKSEFEKILKIKFESIFENQPFKDALTIVLKNTKPKLEWKIESFRNKIQPGSTENWSFQLKTDNARKEAEILASMYDSSLDQFTTKEWKDLVFNDYYNYDSNKSRLGFHTTTINFRNLNTYLKGMQLNNESISLIWFGFDFNNSHSASLHNQYYKQLGKKAKKPANAKVISGIITDFTEIGVPGVNIVVKGTKRGTESDFDGYYEIEALDGEELVFSYIGLKTKTIKISKEKNIDIVLENDSNQLEAVVVTAFGMKTVKKSFTGSVTRIKSEEIQENSDSILDTLSGIVSGIAISGAPGAADNLRIRGAAGDLKEKILYILDGEIVSEDILKNINSSEILSMEVLKEDKATALYGTKGTNGAIIITTKKALEALTQVKARKNLSETAFFLPHLKTDAKGNVSFNFTSPEALTSWKLRLLAHNKEAASGYLEKMVVTQKDLMVLPNFPRFLREKDTIVITAKISNIANEIKTGIAILQFFDATTMEPIDAKMLNAKNVKNFSVGALGNTTASWTITIPEGLQGVQYKILAKSGNFSDGEENILPVLTNNMLVTESIPIWVRENSKKEYTFENLKNNTSTTLRNHQFTLEYTSNPSWIAIQSLPYLMEYEHECAEQTFARFYANALATEIISSNPKIATVFENWRKNGKLNSKLEENEELKSILLAETPWFNDAQTEDEKKKNIALLFDLEKMKVSQETTFKKLKQKQKSSGGFPWFDGSDENNYITRHILAGLGHLSKLSKTKDNLSKMDAIAKTAIPYLDQQFLENYKLKTKNLKAADKLLWINPNADLHHLYARSFYLENYPLSDTLKKASKMYLDTAKKNWLTYSLYEKGLAALTLNRFGDEAAAETILESLKETASNNEDWGMYWIANKSGWYWYQAPIETQALLIEAFSEINNDTKAVDAMKVWLLKNKQTKNWPTTKSTTEAIYALLLQGTDWLSVKDNTVITLGDEKIMTKKLTENEKEAETGYLKLNWKADEVKKEMATVKIENKSNVPGFGGIYWQYFEDLDKIKTNTGAILSVSKELYHNKSTIKGNELEKITAEKPLQIGDLITVRLLITSKEDTEFVHLKDMRASCFEPVDVLSKYQYRDGLGYYTSTKDAATHLFFDKINKGTYVIEYNIRVNNSGEFSNGITTIESMYAPEFTSHTKGIRVKVK